LLIALVFEV